MSQNLSKTWLHRNFECDVFEGLVGGFQANVTMTLSVPKPICEWPLTIDICHTMEQWPFWHFFISAQNTTKHSTKYT